MFLPDLLISPRLDARIGVELDNYCALAARLRMAISPENLFILYDY